MIEIGSKNPGIAEGIDFLVNLKNFAESMTDEELMGPIQYFYECEPEREAEVMKAILYLIEERNLKPVDLLVFMNILANQLEEELNKTRGGLMFLFAALEQKMMNSLAAVGMENEMAETVQDIIAGLAKETAEVIGAHLEVVDFRNTPDMEA